MRGKPSVRCAVDSWLFSSRGKTILAYRREDGRRLRLALLEVLLAVVLLMGVMVATTSLVVSAVRVGVSSRMRVLATDIASGQLDCAAASLNVTTFPTPAPCNEPASLINEMGLSGDGTAAAIASVSEAGFTFTIEQQVNPGNSACAAPAGLAPPELQITDWVTWVSGVTYASSWWEPGTATNASLTGRYVEESTLVAVPASALNQNDGSLLVNVTNHAVRWSTGCHSDCGWAVACHDIDFSRHHQPRLRPVRQLDAGKLDGDGLLVGLDRFERRPQRRFAWPPNLDHERVC